MPRMEHVVVYEVAGVVNNVPVTIEGRGTLTEGGLTVEQNADRDVIGWDAALIAPCCLDALLAIAAGASSRHEPGIPVPIRGWTMLFDENGREVGRAVCSGTLALDNGTLRLRAQFLEATFRLELGERITRIGAPFPISILPAGSHAVLTSAWSFETSRGNLYRGWTTTTAAPGCEGCAARVLSVDEVSIERGRETDTIRVIFPR